MRHRQRSVFDAGNGGADEVGDATPPSDTHAVTPSEGHDGDRDLGVFGEGIIMDHTVLANICTS